MKWAILILLIIGVASCSKSTEDKVEDAKKRLEYAEKSGNFEEAYKAHEELKAAKEENRQQQAEKANDTKIDDELLTKIHEQLVPEIDLKENPYFLKYWYVNTKYFLANVKVSDEAKTGFLQNPLKWLESPENKNLFANNHSKVQKLGGLRLENLLQKYFFEKEGISPLSAQKAEDLALKVNNFERVFSFKRQSDGTYKRWLESINQKTLPKLEAVYKDLKASEG